MRDNLNKYLLDRGIRRSWFAEKIGCTVQRLWQIIEKEHRPSKALAMQIERVTNGEITVEEVRRDLHPKV